MKKPLISLLLTGLILLTAAGCSKEKANQVPGQLKPGTPEFLLNEGIFYLNNGKIDLAERRFVDVLKKRPNTIAAVNGLGIVYTYKKDFSGAVKYFKKALSMDPKFTDVHNSLGVIYTELNKYDLAKEHLLRAANNDEYRTPENAYVNLAKLELKYKKYNSALRYVDKGIRLNKTFAPLYNYKGIINENLKNYKAAISNYEKALSLLTDEDPSILVNLGRIYSKQGDKAKALDILERALSKSMNEPEKVMIRNMIKVIDK